MNELRFSIPIPPRECQPNQRYGSWRANHRAVAKYRRLVGEIARVHCLENRIDKPVWKAAELRATFYKRTKHRSDPDNLLASLKAAIDGLCDAGIFADDSNLTHLPVEQVLGENAPRVELMIRAK